MRMRCCVGAVLIVAGIGVAMAAAIDPKRVFSDPHAVQLAAAAQAGSVAGIQRAVSAGADVNAVGDIPGGRRMTPLVFAVLAPQPDALMVLLAAGAKANVSYEGGMSPLYFAAQKADARFAAALVQAGADVNQKGPEGSLVGDAMLNERDDTVRVLLQKGGDPNGKHGADPLLSKAIYWETLRYIPLLLEAGAQWTDANGRQWCNYVGNKGRGLDRRSRYFVDLQHTWEFLQRRGIRVPCEPLR